MKPAPSRFREGGWSGHFLNISNTSDFACGDIRGGVGFIYV
jgi:hypothetical protein